MGRGHCCLWWAGISGTLDVGGDNETGQEKSVLLGHFQGSGANRSGLGFSSTWFLHTHTLPATPQQRQGWGGGGSGAGVAQGHQAHRLQRAGRSRASLLARLARKSG